MNSVIPLQKGGVYFLVGFMDSELTLPFISTYVYEGVDKEHGNAHMFLSINAAVEGGNENEQHYICFQPGDINGILDKQHLIEWLSEEHRPESVGRTYEYKST